MGHYETRWYRANWGYEVLNTGNKGDAHWGDVMPNVEQLDEFANDFLKDFKHAGWEVKSVVPLIGSHYYAAALANHQGWGSSSWGAGYGFSSSCTVGMLVFLQRWVETENVPATEAATMAPA